MSDPLTTAAVIGGTQLLGGLLAGDQEQTTTIDYDYTPIRVKLKNGATVTMYKQSKAGQTKTTDQDFGDILGNTLEAGGMAYGMGTLYPSGGSGANMGISGANYTGPSQPELLTGLGGVRTS